MMAGYLIPKKPKNLKSSKSSLFQITNQPPVFFSVTGVYNHAHRGDGTGIPPSKSFSKYWKFPTIQEIRRSNSYNKKVLFEYNSQKKQTTLLNFNSKHLSKFNLFHSRIDDCPHLNWANILCKNCDHQLNNQPFKLSCLSNFCVDPECIRNRRKINSMKLQEFHLKSKKLYHFVIGFSEVSKLTPQLRKQYHQIFMKVLDQLNDAQKFYGFSVRDINISKNGNLRLHYHVAVLPIKDFRLFTKVLLLICKNISESQNINISPSFAGYQKTSSIISYFSKRASGVFGHNRGQENVFYFKDIISPQDYFKTFYKTKTFNSFNLKFRSRKRTEFILMLNIIPQVCPKCHQNTNHNTKFVVADPPLNKKPDPPPEIFKQNLEIEVIHIK